MQSHPLIFCITFCISIGLIFFPLNPQYTFRSVPHTDPSTEYSLELTDGLLPLDTHTFDKDALILENEQVRKVTLYNKEKQAYLSLHFNAPVVGLWSPPAKNAPFVCIEPWYGRCDRAHYTGEYKDKDWMQHLQPEEIFQGGYTIEIDE